jgi:Trk-type K+ transport system membrane component
MNLPFGQVPPVPKLDPLTLAITAAIVGALAGVAAFLRTAQHVTWRALISAALNAAALGSGMAMLLFSYFKDNTWFLLGLCLLSGLGGMTLLGFVLAIIRKGGVYVDVHLPQTKEDRPDEHTS